MPAGEKPCRKGRAESMIDSMKSFSLKTSRRTELVNITAEVAQAVRLSNVKEGLCTVFVPHTTAGVTINENADPSVARDVLMQLERIAPFEAGYDHAEENSDAHVKSSLVGPSLTLIVSEGRLALGTWQGVYFCEFDGPRSRKFYVKVIAG